MKKLLFLENEIIWKASIIKRVENKKWNLMVECMCICWILFIARLSDLRSWRQTSCWCHKWWKKHWKKWTRFYNIWCWIKNRCNCETHMHYKYYWWKWITVCDNWWNFNGFMHDMYKSYEDHVILYWEKNTQIDRMDNDWNYCKENCRRVTIKEQSNNKTNRQK